MRHRTDSLENLMIFRLRQSSDSVLVVRNLVTISVPIKLTDCTALTNGVKPSPRPLFTLTLFKASALAHHRCASLWMEGLFVQNWNPFLLCLLLFWLICYEWFCFGIDTHNGWIKLKARYHFKLSAAPRASDHGVDLAVYGGVLQPVNEKKRKVWSDFVPQVRNFEDSWDGKSSDFPSNESGITLFSFFSCYRLFTPESTVKSTPWSDARPCSQIFN